MPAEITGADRRKLVYLFSEKRNHFERNQLLLGIAFVDNNNEYFIAIPHPNPRRQILDIAVRNQIGMRLFTEAMYCENDNEITPSAPKQINYTHTDNKTYSVFYIDIRSPNFRIEEFILSRAGVDNMDYDDDDDDDAYDPFEALTSAFGNQHISDTNDII